MLEYILFSIFTIKMPRSLAAILYIIIYLSTIDRLSVLQLTEKLRGLQALGYCWLLYVEFLAYDPSQVVCNVNYLSKPRCDVGFPDATNRYKIFLSVEFNV